MNGVATRDLRFSQAIGEAIDQCMAADASVYVMGLGVPDPKGIFGTTLGLEKKYGASRVLDMPLAENGMTGVAIGSALSGMKPILVHQRIDFALLAMEQVINQAAKWHYMFGGKMRLPIVLRMVIGRGWGQGPQHSQSLQALFAHVPGLKVVMPATPHDAKGLLVAAIEDPNPVIYIEHRWLHGTFGPVPADSYAVPLGKARTARQGRDVTIVATSHMVLEGLRAAEALAPYGIEAEVIDVRTLKPLDRDAILASVRKTGRLIVADTGWKSCGFAAEVVATACEDAFASLKKPPVRVALPDCPAPTSPALCEDYYPGAADIARIAGGLLDRALDLCALDLVGSGPRDVPDPSFTGPF